MGIRFLLDSKGKKGVAALGLKKLQKFASPDQAQELQELYDVIVSEEGDMDRDLYEEAILVHTLCLIAFHLCAIVLRLDSPRKLPFLRKCGGSGRPRYRNSKHPPVRTKHGHHFKTNFILSRSQIYFDQSTGGLGIC